MSGRRNREMPLTGSDRLLHEEATSWHMEMDTLSATDDVPQLCDCQSHLSVPAWCIPLRPER